MNKKKTAIIFGVSGQDGAYLSDFLLENPVMIYLSSLVITLITFFAPPQSERERVFIDNSNVEFLLAFNDIPVMVDSTNNMTFEQVLFSQKQFSVTRALNQKTIAPAVLIGSKFRY